MRQQWRKRRLGLLSALLLLPFLLWSGYEFSAVADNSDEEAVIRGLEESSEPGCLFAWTTSDAVSRGRFTRRVDRESREPMDQVCRLSSSERRIYYYSDLNRQMGQQIFHVWEFQGREMARVSLGTVKGPRWRVWSSKNLIPGWVGIWVVKVVNKDGVVLHQDQFEYIR